MNIHNAQWKKDLNLIAFQSVKDSHVTCYGNVWWMHVRILKKIKDKKKRDASFFVIFKMIVKDCLWPIEKFSLSCIDFLSPAHDETKLH